MEQVSAILKRYANGRVRALQAVNGCDAGRYRAAGRIKNVADYFSQKSQAVQIKAIRQIENEILLLLPGESSRFRKMRERMLSLLDQAKTT